MLPIVQHIFQKLIPITPALFRKRCPYKLARSHTFKHVKVPTPHPSKSLSNRMGNVRLASFVIILTLVIENVPFSVAAPAASKCFRCPWIQCNTIAYYASDRPARDISILSPKREKSPIREKCLLFGRIQIAGSSHFFSQSGEFFP